MAKSDVLIEELVTANRILAKEGVVDSFGHISVRHPERKDRFLLSRARAPERIDADDIVEFTLEGDPINAGNRKPYLERFIHGAIYEARPEINSVVHNHSPSVIPFGVTGKKLKPFLHMCGCMGYEARIWDTQTKFKDTALLVENMAMGRDLARFLGKDRTALMRGHGSVVTGPDIRYAVFVACYLEVGAKLQMQALQLGKIKFLTKREVDIIIERTGPYTINRAWENWCRHADRPFREAGG